MTNVVKFPDSLDRMIKRLNFGQADWDALAAYGENGETRREELRPFSVGQLRHFWDNIGDNSFYEGPEGMFDCADIHAVMNEKGDGIYCAV